MAPPMTITTGLDHSALEPDMCLVTNEESSSLASISVPQVDSSTLCPSDQMVDWQDVKSESFKNCLAMYEMQAARQLIQRKEESATRILQLPKDTPFSLKENFQYLPDELITRIAPLIEKEDVYFVVTDSRSEMQQVQDEKNEVAAAATPLVLFLKMAPAVVKGIKNLSTGWEAGGPKIEKVLSQVEKVATGVFNAPRALIGPIAMGGIAFAVDQAVMAADLPRGGQYAYQNLGNLGGLALLEQAGLIRGLDVGALLRHTPALHVYFKGPIALLDGIGETFGIDALRSGQPLNTWGSYGLTLGSYYYYRAATSLAPELTFANQAKNMGFQMLPKAAPESVFLIPETLGSRVLASTPKIIGRAASLVGLVDLVGEFGRDFWHWMSGQTGDPEVVLADWANDRFHATLDEGPIKQFFSGFFKIGHGIKAVYDDDFDAAWDTSVLSYKKEAVDAAHAINLQYRRVMFEALMQSWATNQSRLGDVVDMSKAVATFEEQYSKEDVKNMRAIMKLASHRLPLEERADIYLTDNGLNVIAQGESYMDLRGHYLWTLGHGMEALLEQKKEAITLMLKSKGIIAWDESSKSWVPQMTKREAFKKEGFTMKNLEVMTKELDALISIVPIMLNNSYPTEEQRQIIQKEIIPFLNK